MNLFGVKVPWWLLILVAVVVVVLAVKFVWVTIVGAFVLILKIIGILVLAGVGVWGYKKFLSGRS